MTGTADAGIDDDPEGIRGLAWAYGLISPDPAERDAALDRHAAARRKAELAWDRLNQADSPPAG
ncbi:hypothetical protein ACIBBD_27065 [Streptomyces sp. NPDC051315]|uniref:hypothetical protein n=1 Tax=Streptomyces sp. NPDC051315 TaxID=3365650 RepID=UPI0037AC3EA4